MYSILEKYNLEYNQNKRYTIAAFDMYEVSINKMNIVIGQKYLAEIALYKNGILVTDKLFNNNTEHIIGIIEPLDLEYSILNEIIPFIKQMHQLEQLP
jgi:hypothetical protein